MKFVVVNWDYVDRLSRRLAFDIIEDGFEPDCIVALAKGGWFVGRILSDYLGVQRLVSLDSCSEKEISCKKTLIADDLINTGKTMKRALEMVKANEVKTAALFMLRNSEFVPDYFSEYLFDYSWIVFPWNFIEDISEIVLKILRKHGEATKSMILSEMLESYKIDPLSLEVSLPGRFDDVLKVLEERGKIKRRILEDVVYWRAVE
ncbi:MAG: phosphoribosyltransferase [Archaeoglobales archaeon]|nr:phosphoribosyltransferase [Archaeoglobales archaeon]